MGLDDLLSGAPDDGSRGPRVADHDRRRDRRRTVGLSLAAVLAATLVGVAAGLAAALVDGDDRNSSAQVVASADPTEEPGPDSPSPTVGPTGSARPTASVDVPASGTDIGFLVAGSRTSADPVVAELRFDRVQFLTGEEAERAAAANGDEVDNDYYVVNDNPRLRTVQLLGSTTVSGDASFNSWAGEGGQSGPRPRTLDELLRFVATDQGKATLFDLRYDKDGFVTAVVERYVP